MRVKPRKLVLRNFCQFKQKTLEFAPGTIGLTGPNGAGKTNLVRAIYTAMAGEPPGGHLKDMLRWGADFGYVELTLDCDGQPVVVKRDLKRGSHSLESPLLAHQLTKKETVNEWLSKTTGSDVGRLDSVAFVPQGMMTRLLTMRHMERSRLFCGMFGLDRAEKLSQALLKARGALQAPRDRSKELIDIKESVKQLEEARKTLDADLAALRASMAQWNDIYEQARRDSVKETSEAAEARMKAALEELTLVTGRLAELAGDGSADSGDTRRSVEQAFMAGREKARLSARFRELELEAGRIAAEIAAATAPVSTEGLDDQVVACRNRVNDTMRALAVRSKGRCDACGAEYPATEAEMQRLKDSLLQSQQELGQLVSKQKAEERALADYRGLMTSLNCRMVSVRTALDDTASSLKKLEGAAVLTEEEYTKKLGEIDRREARAVEVASLNGRRKLAETALAEAEASPTVPEDTRRKALDVIAAYEDAKSRLSEMERIRLENETRRAILSESMSRIEAENAAGLKVASTLAVLDRAREVLHQDALPRLATGSLVDRFNRNMTEYESVFGYGFSCRLNRDLDFEVDFPGRKGLSVDVLSGGEQMAASAAALMALHGMLAPDFGMLVLDEPTYGLDKDALAALSRVLETACGHLKSQGMIVLIPTHEEALFPVFDDIISINKEEVEYVN